MTMPPEIRAVSFDVGGTLIEPWPSVGHVYTAVAARYGVTGLSPEELTRRFVAAWKARKRFAYTRAEWADLVDATFAGLCARPPSETFFHELYQRFDEPDAWRIYEDVLPTLDALAHRGLKLAIISNWDERLRPLLGRLGLLDRFEAVVVSCEVGWPKPAAEIFLCAARELRLDPDSLLHVGDNLESDVAGARSAGLRALHLRRGAGAGKGGAIRSLDELLPRIGTGRAGCPADKSA